MNPRYLTSADLRHVARGYCRWCGTPVKPPRSSWCDDTCVQAYLIRSRPAAARRAVYKRDSGVCARCGTETDRLLIELRAMDAALDGQVDGPELDTLITIIRGQLERFRAYDVRLGSSRVTRWTYQGVDAKTHQERRWRLIYTSLWEADHIIPVIEGGGSVGLEGLRTLCKPCHKAETAILRARIARAKRPQLELTLGAHGTR